MGHEVVGDGVAAVGERRVDAVERRGLARREGTGRAREARLLRPGAARL